MLNKLIIIKGHLFMNFIIMLMVMRSWSFLIRESVEQQQQQQQQQREQRQQLEFYKHLNVIRNEEMPLKIDFFEYQSNHNNNNNNKNTKNNNKNVKYNISFFTAKSTAANAATTTAIKKHINILKSSKNNNKINSIIAVLNEQQQQQQQQQQDTITDDDKLPVKALCDSKNNNNNNNLNSKENKTTNKSSSRGKNGIEEHFKLQFQQREQQQQQQLQLQLQPQLESSYQAADSYYNYSQLEQQQHLQQQQKRTRVHARPHQRLRRSLTDWLIAPNTHWCGRGNIANNTYNRLGGAAAADRCCRQHDHCPAFIPSMSIRYNHFNYLPYTLSHCSCDRRFRTCLKLADDSDANTIGQLYFNMIPSQCFVLRKQRICRQRTADGSCAVKSIKKSASLRTNGRY